VYFCSYTIKTTNAHYFICIFVLLDHNKRSQCKRLTINIYRSHVAARFRYIAHVTTDNDWQCCVRDCIPETFRGVELGPRAHHVQTVLKFTSDHKSYGTRYLDMTKRGWNLVAFVTNFGINLRRNFNQKHDFPGTSIPTQTH
jgi:hypothetical protein